MNIFDTKRGLNLAAMILGTSSMVAPSLHALTQAEENAKDLIDNWHNYSTDRNGSHVNLIGRALNECNVALYHQNEDGDTLLHTAVREGDVQSVELLMKNGAPIFKRNHNNQTPLDVAREQLAEVQKNAQAYTANGRKILPFMTRYIEKYNQIIVILERSMGGPLHRTHGTTNPWGHGR